MDDRYKRDNSPSGVRPGPSAKKRKSRPQKSQYLLFYILTLFTGVIICVVVFAMVLNSFMNKNPMSQGGETPVPEPTPTVAVAVKEVTTLTGVIKSLDSDKKQVSVYDVDTNKSYTLTVEGSTKLRNKYGTGMVFAELVAGDIVDVSFDKENMVLSSLAGSSEAWETKHTTNVKIDTVERVITLGNKQYGYNDELIAIYKGKGISLNDIQPIDVVTIKGFRDTAWFLEVNKSHGYLTLFNKDRIKDGTLEINTDVYMMLESSEKMEILEGVHVVVVKGSNIESFSKEVTVAQGETTTLDLMDVQVKTGILNIKMNQTDCTVLVDDKTMPSEEPLVLEYGEYMITVQKEDYIPFMEKVVINQPLKEMTIEIEKEVKLGRISVTTIPEGAEVYIDNGFAGNSPVSVPIEYGTHSILAKKEGYTDFTISVEIKGNDQSWLFTLQKQENVLPGVLEPITE